MQAHYPEADPATQFALMALAVIKNDDGTRRNAAEIAEAATREVVPSRRSRRLTPSAFFDGLFCSLSCKWLRLTKSSFDERALPEAP